MEQAQDLYKSRGYSDDLLPKIESQRNWKTFNYFTLWMGSVHNVIMSWLVVFLFLDYQRSV